MLAKFQISFQCYASHVIVVASCPFETTRMSKLTVDWLLNALLLFTCCQGMHQFWSLTLLLINSNSIV